MGTKLHEWMPAAALVLGLTSAAPGFEITRYTIDGGGAEVSAATLTLNGTISADGAPPSGGHWGGSGSGGAIWINCLTLTGSTGTNLSARGGIQPDQGGQRGGSGGGGRIARLGGGGRPARRIGIGARRRSARSVLARATRGVGYSSSSKGGSHGSRCRREGRRKGIRQ